MANTTPHGWILIALFIALTFAMAMPFGAWLFALYEGRTPKYLGFLAPVERALYRASGVDPSKEQGWRGYAIAKLLFSAVGILLTYAIERLQFYLPVNPQGFAGVSAPVAFNTAVSFITNTNWQSYAGESTMSNFTQMAALAVHNFLSAVKGQPSVRNGWKADTGQENWLPIRHSLAINRTWPPRTL